MQVEWSTQALKDLERLPSQMRQRASDAIERFAERGVGDIEKMQGSEHLYRQRVGVWRVIFRWTPGEDVTHIRRVRHRKEAYR